MPPHGCLFAVILGKIRGNSGIHKVKRVVFDGFEAFGGSVITIFWG